MENIGAREVNSSIEKFGCDVSISIVSHGQGDLVCKLLNDIQALCTRGGYSFEVLLTLNVPESLPFQLPDFSFPLKIISNSCPKGFGANHNAAFKRAGGKIYCILNPDIRLLADPIPTLSKQLDQKIGIVAPIVMSSAGTAEDSARNFPTPLRVLCKAFGGCQGGDYKIGSAPIYPDWLGGMFMMLRCETFRELGGFDPKFFLYYEDVDLCARTWLSGYKVMLCPSVSVIHDARRDSHRKLKYLKWHLISMLKFFISPTYWRVMMRGKYGDKRLR